MTIRHNIVLNQLMEKITELNSRQELADVLDATAKENRDRKIDLVITKGKAIVWIYHLSDQLFILIIIWNTKYSFYLDTYRNISFNLNQRLQLDVEKDDLEIEVKSINRFGIFGSNSRKLVASIVSHDWFHPFNGRVILHVIRIIA